MIFKVEFANLKVEHFKRGDKMPIMEVENGEEFIEKMKKMCPKELAEEKGGAGRYKLIVARENRRAIFKPTVTTQGLITLLLRDLSGVAEDRIIKEAGEIKVEIDKCLNFWFDERKEPPARPLKKSEIK